MNGQDIIAIALAGAALVFVGLRLKGLLAGRSSCSCDSGDGACGGKRPGAADRQLKRHPYISLDQLTATARANQGDATTISDTAATSPAPIENDTE